MKLVIFDCDSTLSAIEGVDELARVRGPEVFEKSEAMTNAAMEGKIRVEDVFGARLKIIQPHRDDVAKVGQLYLDTIEPDAVAVIADLKNTGWTPIILSGGFRQAIQPLAKHLGIERIEAVDLFFDAAGNYTGFDEQFPTTRSGGKPARIADLKKAYAPVRTVMIGDGASDLEAKPVVDLFVGFGRYLERPKVKAGSQAFIYRLADLPALLT
ncbi:HAD-IB family phosphatase [Oleiharenicola lentus]|uniref:HAD-IB family phosphatase n=1 Tax=Oleiharenicola lentus TaxID=2508720 RepID=UPI003F675438